MSWAALELSEVNLGDKRLNRRLVKIVEDLSVRPGASVPLPIQNSKFKIEMGIPQPITERTFAFAVRIVNLCKVLDENPGVARTMSKQLIRSGTSIGANVEESQSAQRKPLTIQNSRRRGRQDVWIRGWCDLMPMETAKAIPV